jgi:hypothetical protein
MDDPVRIGAINAYEAVMKHLTIAATCVAVVPLLLAIFVTKEFKLTDLQNAFDKTDNAGRPTRALETDEDDSNKI